MATPPNNSHFYSLRDISAVGNPGSTPLHPQLSQSQVVGTAQTIQQHAQVHSLTGQSPNGMNFQSLAASHHQAVQPVRVVQQPSNLYPPIVFVSQSQSSSTLGGRTVQPMGNPVHDLNQQTSSLQRNPSPARQVSTDGRHFIPSNRQGEQSKTPGSSHFHNLRKH